MTRAQSGVARTFLFAGTATLLAAIVLGFAFATRLSRPLRRMAATADRCAQATSPSASTRAGRNDEVRVLADSFDRCSTGSKTRSRASAASSPTPRTSCARR